jgi:chemotaxis family two-component system response regulator PixH
MSASTILVIVENPIQREELVTILHQQGFRVLTASDGNEAINWLSSHLVPDLILLDLLMPSGTFDGWWLLKQRQRIPEFVTVPVIILTALSLASKPWAVSLGASGLLRKPIEGEALLSEIRRCLSMTEQS